MRGLIAARTAVMTAVAAIDTDMRRTTRGSAACRRLMTIPGVGQLTALAFVAAIDDPSRIRRSRHVSPYRGLVSRRHQSGEIDYVGSISKCGDRRVRTLLYEAANVMLTRYKGQLKLKDWAFAIAKIDDAQSASCWRAASLSSCMRCCETERSSHRPKPTKTGSRNQLPRGATPKGGSRRRRGLCSRGSLADCDFNRAALHPAFLIKCRTSTQRTQASQGVDSEEEPRP